METTHTFSNSERYVTVKRMTTLPAYCGWLTEPILRHLIFAAKPSLNSKGEALPTNGLDKAIIKIGRKVLIDRLEFDAWVEQQRITNDAICA